MSNKPASNPPVTDGFDFVKKIWGSLSIPGVMSPTTDLDELDKRISDLKAVDQWLNINLNMLRATIQALEIQRGTIATLKSFSSVTSANNQEMVRNTLQADIASKSLSGQKSEPSVNSDVAAAAAQESTKAMIANATAWWGILQDQFNKVASSTEAPLASPTPSASANLKPKPAATSRKKPAKSTSLAAEARKRT
jgi:hypothetical protein